MVIKKTKEPIVIYKTLHRKLQIEQHKHHLKPRMNSCYVSGRVSRSCSTSGTHRVTLVTNSVISHEWGNDRIVITITEHNQGQLWHIYSVLVNQVMVMTVKLSRWGLNLNTRSPFFSICLLSSNYLLRKSW